MVDLMQFLLITVLFLAFAWQSVRIETFAQMVAEAQAKIAPAASAAAPTGDKWTATVKKGRVHHQYDVTAASEALVIKHLLAKGVDPREIVEIKRATI